MNCTPRCAQRNSGPVGHEDRDALAGPHAQLEQSVGGPLNVGQNVAPRDLVVLPLQPCLVGVIGHAPANDLLNGPLRPSHRASR